MIQQYIQYLIGGRFFLESNVHKIEARNAPTLSDIPAHAIGFRFFSREEIPSETEGVLKGGKTLMSGTTYFGTELTLAQIKERNRPEDKILISNMEGNGYPSVVETKHGQVFPLNKDDKVISYASFQKTSQAEAKSSEG